MSEQSSEKSLREASLKEAIELGVTLSSLYENPRLKVFVKNPMICKDLDKVLEAALKNLKLYIGKATLELNKKDIE